MSHVGSVKSSLNPTSRSSAVENREGSGLDHGRESSQTSDVDLRFKVPPHSLAKLEGSNGTGTLGLTTRLTSPFPCLQIPNVCFGYSKSKVS